jgi:hypothetical protein
MLHFHFSHQKYPHRQGEKHRVCAGAKFLISHNPNIRKEINGNALKHVANFVSFSFSHTDMLVANGYVAHGQRAP